MPQRVRRAEINPEPDQIERHYRQAQTPGGWRYSPVSAAIILSPTGRLNADRRVFADPGHAPRVARTSRTVSDHESRNIIMEKKVFLVTGVSSGFGRAFSEAAIAAGHTVVGTVRRESDHALFEAIDPQRARAVVLDVTDFDSIDDVVAAILAQFGRIDVLINNAGYGHEGVFEESPLEAMRHQFEVNVFGAVAMMKAVLPGMRERRSGHIINVSSIAGYVPLAGIAYYVGSKFALEGITGVLAKEAEAFGIKVTAIAPGSFRTDWAGRSMIRSARTIADYDALFDPIRKAREEKSGEQAGDPARAALALLKLIDAEHPPVHLLLGTDALALVRARLAELEAQINAWEPLSRSTDFAAPLSAPSEADSPEANGHPLN